MPTSHRPNPAERWLSSANARVSARCEAALASLLSSFLDMSARCEAALVGLLSSSFFAMVEIKESFKGELECRM